MCVTLPTREVQFYVYTYTMRMIHDFIIIPGFREPNEKKNRARDSLEVE